MTTQEKEKITNLTELIAEAGIDAEEDGDLHGENCSVNMEDPDECDCSEMEQIKHLLFTHMTKVNHFWCDMTEAHRKHCTPDGNKELTRFLGKKNRLTSSPTE